MSLSGARVQEGSLSPRAKPTALRARGVWGPEARWFRGLSSTEHLCSRFPLGQVGVSQPAPGGKKCSLPGDQPTELWPGRAPSAHRCGATAFPVFLMPFLLQNSLFSHLWLSSHLGPVVPSRELCKGARSKGRGQPQPRVRGPVSSVHPRALGIHSPNPPRLSLSLLGNRTSLTHQGLSWKHLGSRPGPALCGLLSPDEPETPEICVLVPPAPFYKVDWRDAAPLLHAHLQRPPVPKPSACSLRAHFLFAGPSVAG